MQRAPEYQGWNESFEQPPPAPMYHNYDVQTENKAPFQDQYEVPPAPQADPEQSAAERSEFKKQKWKMSAFAIFSLLILIFNVVVLGVFARGGDLTTPINIFQGSCTESNRFSFWIHLLINGFSSMLLMGSFASIQTTRQVREARSRYFGLALMFFLGISSLLIHLFYNAAVYQTVGTTSFYVAAVGEEFLSSAPTTISVDFAGPGFVPVYEDMRANGSTWDKMSNLDCIKTYGADFLTVYRNLIVVTSNSSSSVSSYFFVDWRIQDPTYGWMCGASDFVSSGGYSLGYGEFLNATNCTVSSLESGAANWTVGYPVEYCLSEPVNSQCWIDLNWFFLVAVVVCNVIKAICMVRCLRELIKEGQMLTVRRMRSRLGSVGPRRWIGAPKWIWPIWLFWTSLVGAVACLVLVLMRVKENGYGIDFISLWNMGFGTVSTGSTLDFSNQSSILGISILTNIPQMIVSSLFFSYTSNLTTMVAYSKCANAFATAKQLAAAPRSLPFYYSFVVGAFATVVHWMASQAFFPISLQILDDGYNTSSSFYNNISEVLLNNNNGLYVNAGYSPIAIIFTIIVGVLAFVLLLAMGLLRTYNWN